MKAAMITTLVLLTSTTYAASKQKVAKAIKLAANVQRNVQLEAQYLTNKELTQVNKLLRQANKILKGSYSEPSEVCSDTDDFATTFKEAKKKLYAPSGLDFSSSQSIQMAQDLTSQYSCDGVMKFLNNAIALKKFAYAPSGMDRSSQASKDFGLEYGAQLCDDSNYQQVYKNAYKLAYSPSGMDMSSQQSHAYAFDKLMKSNAFSCEIE